MQQAETQRTKEEQSPTSEQSPGVDSPPDGDPQQSKENWGSNVRLALACITPNAVQLDSINSTAQTEDTNVRPEFSVSDSFLQGQQPPDSTAPSDIASLRTALHKLSHRIDSHLAEHIELLVQFDDLEGWKESGARHCVAWMNSELGVERKLGWERLRVGRALRALPVMRALFRKGELSWSKVRLLSRIANEDNERELARVALDASVSDVQRICQEFHWADTGDNTDEPGCAERENTEALVQQHHRRLTWQVRADGMTEFRALLAPVDAQNILKSLEHCEEQVYQAQSIQTTEQEPSLESNSDDEVPPTIATTPRQRQADAWVLMAERSLAFSGVALARADRYQVVVSVEADSLSHSGVSSATTAAPYPRRRSVVEGSGPIARSTARRIACDATRVVIGTRHHEPVSIGRRSRIWPAPMRRAILARDRHCQFPGCDADRHLQIHHLVHWADGGETSVKNGVSLCGMHHTLVHEGGFSIERATVAEQQSAGPNQGLTLGLESRTRRTLLPTRCRFRVTKTEGKIKGVRQASTDTSSCEATEITAVTEVTEETDVIGMGCCTARSSRPSERETPSSNTDHRLPPSEVTDKCRQANTKSPDSNVNCVKESAASYTATLACHLRPAMDPIRDCSITQSVRQARPVYIDDDTTNRYPTNYRRIDCLHVATISTTTHLAPACDGNRVSLGGVAPIW